MSAVDSITALSGYQVQYNQNNTQIQKLQSIIDKAKQNPNISYRLDYYHPSNTEYFDAVRAVLGLTDAQTSQLYSDEYNYYTSLDQLNQLQTQQNTLSQIISQLQKNITQYDTPSPISSSNPSISSDTAHNIANTLSSGISSVTSALSSVPKTDLYIGLGVVALLLILK